MITVSFNRTPANILGCRVEFTWGYVYAFTFRYERNIKKHQQQARISKNHSQEL